MPDNPGSGLAMVSRLSRRGCKPDDCNDGVSRYAEMGPCPFHATIGPDWLRLVKTFETSSERSRSMPKLLLFPELMEHGVLLGRRQVDRLEHKGDFPKRVPIGESRVGWIETEIDAHVKRAIDGRSIDKGMLGSSAKKKNAAR
jgi:prophage regulatory protein